MEVCRTCMSERSVQLVPVYSKLDDAFIANIIMECTSIQVRVYSFERNDMGWIEY